MSAANGAGGSGRGLMVGPLAVPGFLLVLVGIRQHRRLFALLGAVLVGLAVRLVDRPGPLSENEARDAEAEPASPEPSADQPETA